MACNHNDYIQPGTELTCADKCKLKKADERYPNGCALTVGKKYKCTGVDNAKQTFSCKDDAGITRHFKQLGDKYFKSARTNNGSFGGTCGAFVAGCSELSTCTGGDQGGKEPQSLFYCDMGEGRSIVVDCISGACHMAFGAAGGFLCKTMFTSSGRCETLARDKRNRCSPNLSSLNLKQGN